MVFVGTAEEQKLERSGCFPTLCSTRHAVLPVAGPGEVLRGARPVGR